MDEAPKPKNALLQKYLNHCAVLGEKEINVHMFQEDIIKIKKELIELYNQVRELEKKEQEEKENVQRKD